MTNRDYYFNTSDITRRNMQKRSIIMFATWLRVNKYLPFGINGDIQWRNAKTMLTLECWTEEQLFDIWCEQECEDVKQGQAT